MVFSISFHLFLVFCCPDPCVIVFQVVSLCLFCFLWLEELIDVVFPSLFRSSHCSACFGSNAEAWIPFCCFFVNLVSGCEAILIANHHFIFFFSAVSMSSSVSSMKETSLSWSQSVFELLLSSVSPSEFFVTVFVFLSVFVHWLLTTLRLFLFLAFLHFLLVLSLCLYNEAKHLALCRSDQSFTCL